MAGEYVEYCSRCGRVAPASGPIAGGGVADECCRFAHALPRRELIGIRTEET
jgi:hypothetical protein